MSRTSVVELCKEYMKFSAGHFTILSPTVRENLHGHNYSVYAAFTTLIDHDGLSFDYRHYKGKLKTLCESLDEITLIPGNSNYIRMEEQGEYCEVYFNDEKMVFLKRDIRILSVANITVEELSNWLLSQLLQDKHDLESNHVVEILIKVFSSPGQSGSAHWSHQHD